MEQIKEKEGLRALVLRSIAFLLPLLILLGLLSLLFEPKNNSTEAGMESVEANGILAEPENTIDALIIGDSESFSALSPMQMWEEQGFTCYVCGSHSQSMMKSYDFLVKALRTQSPKVMILETNAVFRRIYPQQIVYNNAANRLKVFRYHDRWKSLSAADFLSVPHYTCVTDVKGFLIRRKSIPVDENDQGDYMRYEKGKRRIRLPARWYLEKIRRLCEKRGIQLVFLSTPSTHNWDYRKHNCIQNYADRHGCAYLDMNLFTEEIGIDWSKDSKDGGDHLNLKGAQKATSYFADWLKETVELPDRREEADYQSWNESLERYHETIDSGSEPEFIAQAG